MMISIVWRCSIDAAMQFACGIFQWLYSIVSHSHTILFRIRDMWPWKCGGKKICGREKALRFHRMLTAILIAWFCWRSHRCMFQLAISSLQLAISSLQLAISSLARSYRCTAPSQVYANPNKLFDFLFTFFGAFLWISMHVFWQISNRFFINFWISKPCSNHVCKCSILYIRKL